MAILWGYKLHIQAGGDFAYGINALDSERKYHIDENGNGLDNLTNKYYPFIVYAISCDVTPYDNYEDYICSMNIGQSMTLGKDYGSVVFMGNTRKGIMGLNASLKLEETFWNYLASDSLNCLGRSYKCSKFGNYFVKHGHYLRLSHNYIGDPALCMWTNIPEMPLSLDVNVGVEDYSVSSDSINGLFIAETPLNKSVKPNIDIINGNSLTLSNTWNKAYCIYGPNNIPTFLPLRLDNITLDDYNYVRCSNLLLSSQYSQHSAPVIFSNGADYTFNITGDAILASKVRIQNGAKVTVIAEGDVKITNVGLAAGATLEIYCNNFIIDNIQLENGNTFAGNLIVHAKNKVTVNNGNITAGLMTFDCKDAEIGCLNFPAGVTGGNISVTASRDVYLGRINSSSGTIKVNCRKCFPYKSNFNIGSTIKINQNNL